MNFLLEITKEQYNQKIFELFGFGETFIFGAKIALIGMAAVFSALCLIWLSLCIFKIVFHDIPAKKAARPVAVAAPVAEEKTVEYVSDDAEIIAVIAAAIAMAESESLDSKFKVVSFRRT